MPRKGSTAKAKPPAISNAEVQEINKLEPDQMWLLSKAHIFQSDVEFEAGAVRERLGVSEEQAKAVGHVIEHYAVGMALGYTTPASAVGKLVERGINVAHATNLANAAHSAYRYMRNTAESRLFFVLGDINELNERLAKIEKTLSKGDNAARETKQDT